MGGGHQLGDFGVSTGPGGRRFWPYYNPLFGSGSEPNIALKAMAIRDVDAMKTFKMSGRQGVFALACAAFVGYCYHKAEENLEQRHQLRKTDSK